MLSGKDVSRAIRGHLLVCSALNTVLVANAYNLPLSECPDSDEESGSDSDSESDMTDVEESTIDQEDVPFQDLEAASEVLDRLLDGECSSYLSPEILNRISAKINEVKGILSTLRTAKLWLQYMDMIEILCRFIKAERTGNFNLHLSVVQEMLPYFAASGHNSYTKSAYMYLHTMQSLKDDHPVVHDLFQAGYHVRRSDNAQQVGKNILLTMIEENALEYTFKRKSQAVTLGLQTAVMIQGEAVQVDPQLLLQRLSIVACNGDDAAEAFRYELCSYTPALFESPQLLRQPIKHP